MKRPTGLTLKKIGIGKNKINWERRHPLCGPNPKDKQIQKRKISMLSTRLSLNSIITSSVLLMAGILVVAGSVNVLQAESACTAPYLTVEGPGTPGVNITTDPTGELSIDRVGIGEPFSGICSEKSITFVMKVHTMDPQNTGQATPLPNAQWEIRLILPSSVTSDHVAHPIFVEMQTEDLPAPTAATVSFAFGYTTVSPTGGGLDNGVCSTNGSVFTCPVSGTVTPDGTITIKLDVAAPLNFTDATGATVFSASIPPGTNLTALEGDTYIQAGASPGGTGGGLLEQTNHTAKTGAYTTAGNHSCAPPPTAGLSAAPLSGPAGLTVTFDASTSANHNPCAVLNSMTMNYGDGSPLDTHTGTPPSPTFSHTYTSANTYTASLTVGNTDGQVSTNTAQEIITVTSALPPPLSKVVSRKNHSGTDFDITLFDSTMPLAPRGIECRTGGGFGDFTMVFTFVNNLVNAAGISASVTTGVAAVSSSAPGPAANQYTVNITGATFPEYVAVTLSGAADSLGNSGAVAGPQMGVLEGDTNADGRVNVGDTNQTKARSGAILDQITGTFRSDVNLDGRINVGDTSFVKSHSGTVLPP